MLKTLRWLLITLALAGSISAQTPTATVHDYLSEVRIFPSGSPDFAKIATGLGVDATLPTLPGASLVVALRNDSGQTIDSMRIVYLVNKGGKPIPRVTLYYGLLGAGAARLVTPVELRGLAALLNPAQQGQGLVTGATLSRVPSLVFYQGATVTVSVDSATLAVSGRFIGADTQNFFSRLVAEDAAQKSFFSGVAGFQAAALSQSVIEQALTKRQADADAAKRQMFGITGLNLAAMSESDLCSGALMRLKQGGMANLFEWAAKESAALQSKPSIHR